MGLLKHTEHFEKLDGLAVLIDAKKGADSPRELALPERVLDQIWTAEGVLENGSFQYFFECGLDAGAVAQAYDQIGMQNVGDLFRNAERITGPVNDKPWKERLQFLEQHENELDHLATEILKYNLDSERKLAEYVEQNASLFHRTSTG